MFILLSEADCRPYICLKLSLNIQLTLWLRSLFCKHIIEPWNCCNTAAKWGIKTFLMPVTWLFLSTLTSVFLHSWANILSNLSESSQWKKNALHVFLSGEPFCMWKGEVGDWREDSVVETICCSWQGPRFSSHTHHSQLLVTAVPGNLTPSFGLHGHLHVHSAHVCARAHAHIHKRIHKEVFLKEKLSNWSLNFYFICINVWAACVSLHHVCAYCHRKSEEGVGSLATKDNYEPLCEWWELNLAPLEEQLVFSNTEPSLQPPISLLKNQK